jgi:YhhN family
MKWGHHCGEVLDGPSGEGRFVALAAADTLLALEKFAGLHLPAHEGVVMATYTTAQALLAGPPPA